MNKNCEHFDSIWSSKLQETNEGKQNPCCITLCASRVLIYGLVCLQMPHKSPWMEVVKFLSEELPLSQKLRYLGKRPFLKICVLSIALCCSLPMKFWCLHLFLCLLSLTSSPFNSSNYLIFFFFKIFSRLRAPINRLTLINHAGWWSVSLNETERINACSARQGLIQQSW